MRFYFNEDENICVDEDWLIDFLSNKELTKDEIRQELQTTRCYCGWFECEVSDSIHEKFS